MENHISKLEQQQQSVYPGAYIPILHQEDVKEALKATREGTIVQPPVNIREFNECYTVEVCTPGLNREDFLITVEDQSVHITVLQKELIPESSTRFQLHEFNYECFEREIMLPLNADTEQTRSEYQNGLLHLLVPKTNNPVDKVSMEVVVY